MLRSKTPESWVDTVLADFDTFLIDHAAAEKKASGMAMSMLSHYPDKEDIVRAMADLAIEELAHFKEVLKIMIERGLTLAPDTKDPYVNALRQHFRKGSNVFFLDRLLVGGIVEARGCERFDLVAQALPDGRLQKFYRAIADSEAKHHELFITLAKTHFDDNTVEVRLSELLDIEAEIVRALPIRSALH